MAFLYKISIVRLPPAVVPLNPMVTPRYADTEAEAHAVCSEFVRDGYGVEVTGTNIHWDHAEVLRRLNSSAAK